MKTMTVAEFKTHTRQVLDRVSELREGIIVTKGGKPLVQIVPCEPSETKPVPGKLSKMLVFEKDIVSPLYPS